MNIEIHHSKRKHYDGSTIHTYEAFCLRCNKTVQSNPDRIGVVHNWAWNTKAPAVKAAHDHAARHRRADARVADGTYLRNDERVVATIAIEEEVNA